MSGVSVMNRVVMKTRLAGELARRSLPQQRNDRRASPWFDGAHQSPAKRGINGLSISRLTDHEPLSKIFC